MIEKKKLTHSMNLYGYLCFLFSFIITADSCIYYYSLNVPDYTSIIYFIFHISAGLLLGLLGFSMVVTSKLYEKLDEKIMKKILDLSNKYTNQINNLKIFLLLMVFLMIVTISFQYIGVIFGIIMSVILSALFLQILLKTLK